MIIRGDDLFLSDRSVVDMQPGVVSSATLTVPLGTYPTGTYYLGMRTDPNNRIVETNEANNTKVGSGTFSIGPDLRIHTLSANLSGTNILISDTEQNIGNQDTGPFSIGFYFSVDAILDTVVDPIIGTRSSAGVRGGSQTDSATNTFAIPATVPTGTYRVCALSDSAKAITELNESNNSKCTSQSYSLGPDLKVFAIQASRSGSNLVVTDTQQNSGNQPSGPYTVSLHLSTDTVLDAGDILLGSRSVSNLSGGSATQTRTTLLPIPAGLPPGAYYIIARSDSDQTVVETSETNNTKATSGTLSLP